MERIVIASRVGANIYKFSKTEGFELVREHPNPIGRLRNTSMQNAPAGSSRAKYKGSAPHRLDREKDPHEEAADQFARDLSKSLLKDMKKNNDLTLRVVAEERLLGKIRSHFKDHSLEERIRWIGKDLEKVPEKKWPKLIGLPSRPTPPEISNRFPI